EPPNFKVMKVQYSESQRDLFRVVRINVVLALLVDVSAWPICWLPRALLEELEITALIDGINIIRGGDWGPAGR
ncbi:hypothetical protein Q9189_005986, partial [Teloschistes chrysophthalmus]